MEAFSCVNLCNVFCDKIASLSEKCIDTERVRGLSGRSISELRRCFALLQEFVRLEGMTDVADFTPQSLKDFLLQVNPTGSPAQGKTYVWSMRKFFSFLSLRQIIPDNPARRIPHPKARPREKLPVYLKPGEIRALLETAAAARVLQDFTILSLLIAPSVRENGEMDRYELTAIIGLAAGKAGIDRKVTPLMLRHTFATHMYEAGVPVRDLQEMMGHSRMTETSVYIHVTVKAAQKLLNDHLSQFHYYRDQTP